MTSVSVNGQYAETGCYIDSHWGQYGPPRVGQIAEDFGFKFYSQEQDPRYWSAKADHPATVDRDRAFEEMANAIDMVEDWLNEVTHGGVWFWEYGEFFLRQWEFTEVS